MSWAINDVEIENVTKLSGKERFAYTVKRIADWEELWGLYHDGWAIAITDDKREVIPIWPHEKYAESCAEGNWQEYLPKKIDLDSWLAKWTPGLLKDKRLVGVFPTSLCKGVVVSPSEFSLHLEEELEKFNP